MNNKRSERDSHFGIRLVWILDEYVIFKNHFEVGEWFNSMLILLKYLVESSKIIHFIRLFKIHFTKFAIFFIKPFWVNKRKAHIRNKRRGLCRVCFLYAVGLRKNLQEKVTRAVSRKGSRITREKFGKTYISAYTFCSFWILYHVHKLPFKSLKQKIYF